MILDGETMRLLYVSLIPEDQAMPHCRLEQDGQVDDRGRDEEGNGGDVHSGE